MSCIPRIGWHNCVADLYYSQSIFHYIWTSLHFVTLISYTIISSISYFRRRKYDVAFQLRMCVLLYSIFACIHNVSLTEKQSLLPKAINEISYNIYCWFIFLTLLLLIRYWVLICIKLQRTEKIYKRWTNIFIISTLSVISIVIISTDIAIIVIDDLEIMHKLIIVQYCIWGVACLLIGLLFAIFGTRIVRRLSNRIITDEKTSRLEFWFKFIYLMYLIISVPNSVTYLIAIIFNNIDKHPWAWYTVYTIFNIAGPLTAAVLYPILYRSSDTSTTTPRGDAPSTPRNNR